MIKEGCRQALRGNGENGYLAIFTRHHFTYTQVRIHFGLKQEIL